MTKQEHNPASDTHRVAAPAADEPASVFGETPNARYAGIVGVNTGGGDGVWGVSVSDPLGGVGVHGLGTTYGVAAAGTEAGVYGEGVGARSTGVFGVVLDRASVGVYGAGPSGVVGKTATDGGEGVSGMTIDVRDAWAVLGKVFSREAEGHGCYAGVFDGDVDVHGAVAATFAGTLVDHPIDPANKLLAHAFVASSEHKTLYDGAAYADDAGEIVVRVPAWMEASNLAFRYQLTAIGAPARDLHVRQEVSGGRFVIAGANPGQKVCWLVTGVRSDAWATAHPLVVERDKREAERGLYRQPRAHGRSEEEGAIFQRLARRGVPAPATLDPPDRPTYVPRSR